MGTDAQGSRRVGRPEIRRQGSVWEYELPDEMEITVYPLLLGRGQVVYGRQGYDMWDKGYDYNTLEEAVEAAEGWIDTDSPPPGDWTKEVLR